MKTMNKYLIIIISLQFLCYKSFSQGQGLVAKKISDDQGLPSDTRQKIWKVAVTPDGDFKTALSKKDVNPITGSLGFSATRYVKFRELNEDKVRESKAGYLNFFVSIASNVDTIQALLSPSGNLTNQYTFGSALLLPTLGGGLAKAVALNGEWSPFYDLPINSKENNKWMKEGSIRYFFNASQNTWQFNNQVGETRLVAWGLYAQWNLIRTNLGESEETENEFEFTPFIGYTARHIGSDIVNRKDVLPQIFGRENRYYHGIDFGVTAVVSNIRTIISFPYFPYHIDGFGYGRFLVNFGFAIPINVATMKKEVADLDKKGDGKEE